jgi:curved DNA-binding protein
MSSNEFKDYYAVLGITKTADTAQIKQKFRKLALKYHPDRNQGNKAAEAKFKEISEAYDVLGDKNQRAKYDRFEQYWQHANTTDYRQHNNSKANNATKADVEHTDFSQYSNFEEFIDELLGRFPTSNASNTSNNSSFQSANQNNPQHSYNDTNNGFKQHSTFTNLEPSISLSYAEAYQGTTKRINLGSKTVEVRIPPGAKPGNRIRLPNKGKPDFNNCPTDLYLDIKLIPHSFFYFQDDNLSCQVPITPDEAVLGLSIDVPTPDGTVNMKIPAGISSGQVLRLKGKGWSSPKGTRSDQLVRIDIAVPQQISRLEREYYQKIRELRRENPRQNLLKIGL